VLFLRSHALDDGLDNGLSLTHFFRVYRSVDAVVEGPHLILCDDAFSSEAANAVPDVELRSFEGLDRPVAGDDIVAGLCCDLDDAGSHRAGP
jgi:hypothetical protein